MEGQWLKHKGLRVQGLGRSSFFEHAMAKGMLKKAILNPKPRKDLEVEFSFEGPGGPE